MDPQRARAGTSASTWSCRTSAGWRASGCRDPGRGVLLARPRLGLRGALASTERIDRGRKLRIYAEAGVAHAWFVKPTDRTLEVFRLRDGAWTIVGVWEGAAVVRAEPFDAVALELAPLWGDPTPPAPEAG